MNEQIGNKINDKTYIKLTPFKGFVLENFPFIEADFDAITNYQLLCKVIEYLNNVISNQNTVQELGTDLVNAYNSLVDAVNLAINEFETDVTADINQFKVDINDDFDEFTTNITTQFNNLQNYVNNYFDNNFPELVSDKLDEMAQDGTLENLLNDTAHLTKSYNTYTDMMTDSSTFTNGLRLKTLGYYTLNDGGGAEYYVNNSVISSNYQIDLNNGLYLNLVINGMLNIKQIGAYGDGTHDDYNVLNIAFNNYKNIYIPSGTYLSNSLISVSNNNLYIKGENNSILKYPSEAGSEITNNQCFITFNNSNYLKIEDIKIDCGGTYITRPYLWQTSEWNAFRTKRYLTYNGIRTNNCDNTIIENIEIYNCCVGIMSKDSSFQTFNNIHIHDTYADGIRIGTGCENSNITNCLFNNLGDDCVAILHEDSNVSESYKPKNIIVDNINGKDCFGAIITMLSAENCHCYNSILIDNKDFPIKLGSSNLGFISKNCSIENVNVITSKRVEGDTYDSEANNIAHGIVSISGSTAHEQNNCILKDCIFESSNGDNKLYRIDGNGYIIDGCQFIGYACRTYNLSDLKMYNCVFKGNDGNYFNGLTNSVIENCDFYNNKTYNWNTNRGLAIMENENCIYKNVYADGTSASDNHAISLYTGSNKGNIFFSSKYNLQPTIVNVTDIYSDMTLIFTIDAFFSPAVFKLGQQVYWTNQDKLYVKKSTGLVEL